MEPENWKFGGGTAETVLHPLVLVAAIIVIIAMLLLPRRHLIVPLLFSAFLIPYAQLVYVAGLHVFVFRIIYLAAILRLLWMKLSSPKPLMKPWNPIDTAFVLMVVFHAVAFSLLYLQKAALINQLSYMWDFIAAYLILKLAIQDEEDVARAVRCFAILTVILSAFMLNEQITGRNLFANLGGLAPFPEIRNGRVRAQAVFQHAILAGTFGAILLPLFLWYWKAGKSKVIAIVGIAGSTFMVAASASSTPLLAWVAAVTAFCMWPFRKRMQLLRWGVAIALISLNVVMKAPVWFLIAHVGVISDSSVYHRADLVDTFVRHFTEWWLLGTSNNGSWGYYMFDTSNQYVNTGVTGGLFALTFFVLTIVRSFKRLGIVRRSFEGKDKRLEWCYWFLGCAVFANSVAFFGISYFDQTQVAWFTLLAIVSAMTSPYFEGHETVPEVRPAAAVAPVRPAFQWAPAPANPVHVPAIPRKQGITAQRMAAERK